MKANKLFCLFTIVLISSLAAKAQSTIQKADTVQTIQLKVKGITCSGDLLMISDHVEKKAGVSKCDAVGKMSTTSTFEVTFNPDKISKTELIKSIEETPSCDHPKEKPYRVKQ